MGRPITRDRRRESSGDTDVSLNLDSFAVSLTSDAMAQLSAHRPENHNSPAEFGEVQKG